MTKEDLIKQAWGELMPNYNSFDLIDGWSLGVFNEDVDYSKFDRVYYKIGFVIRPKSLQGIENNNGWISVNEKLPKEKGYSIMYNGENMVLIELNDTTDMITLRENFLKDGFTHYQPIAKPKPPLF